MRLTLQRAFVLAVLGIVLVVALAFRAEKHDLPHAENGTIDLRSIDLTQGPAVPLAGTWNLYWNRFVPATEFLHATPPPRDATLTLPGSWTGMEIDGQRLTGYGAATLYLRLLLDASHPPLALRLKGFFPANRIWINGQLVSESGTLGYSAADERMEHGLQLVPLPQGARRLDLVIQVSNFHLPKESGRPIVIGRTSELAAEHSRLVALSMFSAGTLLLMGFYHLALFLYRRKNLSPLWLGLYCLLWTAYVLSIESSDEAIRLFWPEAPGELLQRTWQLCLFAVTPVAYLFYRSLYPEEFARWITALLAVVSGIYILLALFAPLAVLERALPVFFLITLARLGYTAWALWLAMRRRREGALILLNGFVLMLLCSINDMLNGLDVIDTVLTIHIGMIIYMFAQALALAVRFSRLFDSVEELSSELAHKNVALHAEIAERNRLQQEVVTVSEEERRRMSQSLHDGLCQLLTGARLQCAAIARRWPTERSDEQPLRPLEELLEASTHQAYELSRGLWPLEQAAHDANAALATLTSELDRPGTARIEFVSRGACAQCVSPIAPQMYGIAREAVTNALKHAQAQTIRVELDCSARPAIELSVHDDGRKPSAAVSPSRRRRQAAPAYAAACPARRPVPRDSPQSLKLATT